MRKQSIRALCLIAASLTASVCLNAQVLLANGTLTGSRAGAYKDLSGLHYNLENGVSADLLGGMGSALAYVSGDTFVALPDRGPNATPYNSLLDDTVSYIPRFHTVKLKLQPNAGTGLPFTLTTELNDTTLLFAPFPLRYGSGEGVNAPSGEPKPNRPGRHYFSGRSDNYDPDQNSGDPRDARLDPEGIRVSNDGLTVFVSDEYGPYIYQFLRSSGMRIRSFRLPDELFVANPKPTGDSEMAANTSGRTPNKGMEGLAITPDGKTLVGIMQASLIQDAAEGGSSAKLVRIFTVDVFSGKTKHEYAYLLTSGSGVSEITAINDHEFLVDERDGKGLGDGSKAKIKQIFRIDLESAVDVTGMTGTQAAANAVTKTLVIDVVKVLTANGYSAEQIPAKLEGLTFGPDVQYNGNTLHTLWIANDNDFLQDYGGVAGSNPNQYFVFGVTDSELGAVYVPQKHIKAFEW